MVDHPTHYRWLTYTTKVQGIYHAVIDLHEQYLELGSAADSRQSGYLGLFEIKTNADELANSRVNLQLTKERWPDIKFSSTRELYVFS